MLPKKMLLRGLPLVCILLISVMLLAQSTFNFKQVPIETDLFKTLLSLQKTQSLNKALAVRSLNVSRNENHINSLNITDEMSPKAREGLRKTIRSWFDQRPEANASTMALSKHPLFPGFVIENPDMCKGQQVDILIYLHSSTENRDLRRQIRESWASPRTFRSINVKVLFILGRPADDMTQLQIETEYSTYGDIVQGNFADTFRNLTYKAITMLAWVNFHCAQARYIVKADDDMFVDTYRVVSDLVPKMAKQKVTAACDDRAKGQILRDPNIKWYVDKSLLPGRKFWPRFCSGYFAAMTGDCVPILYEASFAVPEYLPIDDAYLFGMLMDRKHNKTLNFVNIHDLISPNERPDPDKEINVNGKFEYIAFRVKEGSDNKKLWALRANKLSPWEQAHSNYLGTFQESDGDKFVVL